MDKAKLNYFVDLGLIVTFVLAAGTGIIKFPGLLRSLGFDTSGIPYKEISRVHDWAGIAMAALVVVHIALNWNWIVAMTRKYLKK